MEQLVNSPPVIFRWFYFVPPLSLVFFRPVPPPHRFSFTSPSHTTKKNLNRSELSMLAQII